jgi:hypothetical protein
MVKIHGKNEMSGGEVNGMGIVNLTPSQQMGERV